MKKFFVLLLLPAALHAQKNNKLLLEEYMQAQASIYLFTGNVLVAQHGNVIYKKSFGDADYDNHKKLDSNSVFDCGSIAKEFTAVGVLLLVDKDKIKYTDTLRKFFPELPYTNVTIQQLLTHTSGMPDGFGLVGKFFDHDSIATNTDLIRLLAREKPPLYFTPGENLAYSGTAFNLLASIIEKVSGQSYPVYMHEQVFKPIGLEYTQVANWPRSQKSIPGYASGYLYSDSLKKYILAESQHTGWTTYLPGITGEGMIVTTTGDLLKWDQALKNHSLLKQTTQQKMLSLQAEKTTVPKVQFGYGMRVGKNDLGNFIFHNGYYPGYLSMHIRYIDDDITVIVLSNNESRADYIADALAAITLKKDVILPYAHKEIVNTTIDSFTGKYMMRLARPPYMAAFPVEIARKEDKLFLLSTRGDNIELKPESATKFFFANGTDQQLEFETGDDGKVARVWHIAWGVRRIVSRE